MAGFNFNKLQRKYYPTTLKNGKTYLVEMPKKGTFEKLFDINNTASAGNAEAIDELYETVAEIISNNKAKMPVTKEDLNDYGIDGILDFLREYTDFVKEITNQKN